MLNRMASSRLSKKPSGPLSPTPDVPTLQRAAPTDPAPREGPPPTDVLITRLHEVKRLTKSLASFYEGIAATHAAQSKALLAVAAGHAIPTPFPMSPIFLPAPVQSGGGWANLLCTLRDNTKERAEEQSELAKEIIDVVVNPLKKLRVEIKAHIVALTKEIDQLSAIVVKERETSVAALARLAKSTTNYAGTYANVPASDDPFLVRVAVEAQLKEQVKKENELLKVALWWQEATERFEKGIWVKAEAAWRAGDQAQARVVAGSHMRAANLENQLEEVPSDAEWEFFASKNLLIPAATPIRDLRLVTFPGQSDPATHPVQTGPLERKKRFVRNWKEAFFVITPIGFLHEYPSSASPRGAPTFSVFLPSAALGPLPTPGVSKSGRNREPKFIIESRAAKGKNKEISKVYRAKSWDEVRMWWNASEKFAKQALLTQAKILETKFGPGSIAVMKAGLPSREEEVSSDEELEDGSGDEVDAPETRRPLPLGNPGSQRHSGSQHSATASFLNGTDWEDAKTEQHIPADYFGVEVPLGSPSPSSQDRRESLNSQHEPVQLYPSPSSVPSPSPPTFVPISFPSPPLPHTPDANGARRTSWTRNSISSPLPSPSSPATPNESRETAAAAAAAAALQAAQNMLKKPSTAPYGEPAPVSPGGGEGVGGKEGKEKAAAALKSAKDLMKGGFGKFGRKKSGDGA